MRPAPFPNKRGMPMFEVGGGAWRGGSEVPYHSCELSQELQIQGRTGINSEVRIGKRAARVCELRNRDTGMNHDSYDDNYIRGILNTVKTIAMVGVSANTSRPSYFAFKYLLERRYRMIPVNPALAGGELLGRKAYATLLDIPEPVDMVDIFRASQFALEIVQQALGMNPRPW